MTLVKKSDGLIKHFTTTNSALPQDQHQQQQYSFFYLDDGSFASTYTFNDEEQVRTQAWYPFLNKEMVIFDIGAGYLSYALPALAVGATVHAWSPEHEFAHIQKNIDANVGFRERCNLYNYGLYSEKGWFKTDSMEFYKIVETHKIEFSKREPAGWFIPVMPLDDFVFDETNNIRKIDFIKIDAEGAEVEILKGAIKTIIEFKPPRILVEWHLFKPGCEGLRNIGEPLLAELGYKAEIVIDMPRKDLPHVLYTY